MRYPPCDMKPPCDMEYPSCDKKPLCHARDMHYPLVTRRPCDMHFPQDTPGDMHYLPFLTEAPCDKRHPLVAKSPCDMHYHPCDTTLPPCDYVTRSPHVTCATSPCDKKPLYYPPATCTIYPPW